MTGRLSCGKQWLEITVILLLFLPCFLIHFKRIFVTCIYRTKYTVFEKLSEDTHECIQTRMPNNSPQSSSHVFLLMGTHPPGTTGTLPVPVYCGVRPSAGLGTCHTVLVGSQGVRGMGSEGVVGTLTVPRVRTVPALTTTYQRDYWEWIAT